MVRVGSEGSAGSLAAGEPHRQCDRQRSHDHCDNEANSSDHSWVLSSIVLARTVVVAHRAIGAWMP